MTDEHNADASTASPEGNVPSIPKPRFDEVNGRMKVAEAELAAAQAQKAELEAQLAALRNAEPATPPEPPPATPSPEPKTQAAPSPEGQRLQRLELMAEHGFNGQQADAVTGYLAKGLEMDDAIGLAKMKSPELFGRDARGFDQNAHSAAPPGTRPPRPPAEPTISEQLAATRDPRARGRMALEAAKAMVTAQIAGQIDRQRQ